MLVFRQEWGASLWGAIVVWYLVGLASLLQHMNRSTCISSKKLLGYSHIPYLCTSTFWIGRVWNIHRTCPCGLLQSHEIESISAHIPYACHACLDQAVAACWSIGLMHLMHASSSPQSPRCPALETPAHPTPAATLMRCKSHPSVRHAPPHPHTQPVMQSLTLSRVSHHCLGRS